MGKAGRAEIWGAVIFLRFAHAKTPLKHGQAPLNPYSPPARATGDGRPYTKSLGYRTPIITDTRCYLNLIIIH
jgi:hypothetical protein